MEVRTDCPKRHSWKECISRLLQAQKENGYLATFYVCVDKDPETMAQFWNLKVHLCISVAHVSFSRRGIHHFFWSLSWRWKSSLPKFGLASDCQIVTLQSPLPFQCTLTMPVWLCLQTPDKESVFDHCTGGTSEKWNDLVHEKGKISLPELRINPHFWQAFPLAKESDLLIS